MDKIIKEDQEDGMDKERKSMQRLTSMKLHEFYFPENMECSAYIRVPGGWMFQTWNDDNEQGVNTGTFIPFCLQI